MKKIWLNKVNRFPHDTLDRSKFLRLDKNERVIEFEKSFLVYLKKKVNTFNLTSYPNVSEIKKIIAKKNKVSENMIYLSNGSDLSLKSCFELFTMPRDKVIILQPTFGMVNVYCDLYNLKKIEIKYNKKLELNYDKLLKSISKKISLIIIANPNSPTGTIIETKQMKKILNKSKKYRVPIVIDEAYEGFYKKSYVSYLKKYENLVITRTFSKSFGIAGLRAGYAISGTKISKLLNKFRPMYEINNFSCVAIKYLLENYKIVRKHISEINNSKNFLKSQLTKMGINFIDTHANFFHIELGKNIKKKEFFFKKKGILFRKGPGVKGLESYARFSLGSKLQSKKIINIIGKLNERNI